MPKIKKSTITNNNNSDIIYPKTSADMVNYDSNKTLKEQLDFIDTELNKIRIQIENDKNSS